MPAGVLTLEGDFVDQNRDQVLAVVSEVETREKAEHPMRRVLAIEQYSDRVVVSTADVHLPRRIGEALSRAHGGRLDVAFGHDDYSTRVHWHG
jgi:hypothetical protein